MYVLIWKYHEDFLLDGKTRMQDIFIWYNFTYVHTRVHWLWVDWVEKNTGVRRAGVEEEEWLFLKNWDNYRFTDSHKKQYREIDQVSLGHPQKIMDALGCIWFPICFWDACFYKIWDALVLQDFPHPHRIRPVGWCVCMCVSMHVWACMCVDMHVCVWSPHAAPQRQQVDHPVISGERGTQLRREKPSF